MDKPTCTRCGRAHLGEFVWLELNNLTNFYQPTGTVSEGLSQGLFPFGKTCASRALSYYRMALDLESNRFGVGSRFEQEAKAALLRQRSRR